MSQSRPGGPPNPARESENGQSRRVNLSLELLAAVKVADDPANWLASVLPAIAADLAAGYVALVVADGGRWSALAEAGPARSLPVELLAEVLDREIARSQGNWVVGPLSSRADSAEALVVYWTSAPPPDALGSVESLLPVVREAFASVRAGHQQTQRIRRLETILEIAGQWYQTREIEPLLVQIAEAATRLAEGGSGQHLPLGSCQPLLDRPAGPGREGGRTPRGRRPWGCRARLAVGTAGACR